MSILTCASPLAFADTVFSDSPNVAGESGNMGIGMLGDPSTQFKRKFRFLFGMTYCNGSGTVGASFVKTASRPSISIEETEINFLNEVSWIPGKAKWETIDVTYLDANDDTTSDLFSWLASVYDFTNPCRNMGSKQIDYAGEANLVMLDGCGNPIERWVMGNVWPTSIKFGELDYSSSDIAEIQLTLRYSQVSYTNYCGDQPEPCGCSGC
jgi:tail tube protein gp19